MEMMEFGVPVAAGESFASHLKVDHQYSKQCVLDRPDSPSLEFIHDSDLDTPMKPQQKKAHDELSLTQLQDNVIAALTLRIKESADDLGKMISSNTVSILRSP